MGFNWILLKTKQNCILFLTGVSKSVFIDLFLQRKKNKTKHNNNDNNKQQKQLNNNKQQNNKNGEPLVRRDEMNLRSIVGGSKASCSSSTIDRLFLLCELYFLI